MKTWTKPALAIILIAFLAAIAPAQDAKNTKPTRAKRPDHRNVTKDPKRAYDPQAARGMMVAQQLRNLQAQIDKRKAQFEITASELNAIKKIAQKENATKTVAHIDNLIKRKQQQMETDIKVHQKRMQTIKDQVKKQAQQQAEKPKPTRPKPSKDK